MERVIEDYTREAGGRNFERQIASVTRHVAAQIAKGDIEKAKIMPAIVRAALGPAILVRESTLQTSAPGVVTGLAYTTTGGKVLHIEAIRFEGKGGFTLTGQLCDVMKESVLPHSASRAAARHRPETLRAQRGACPRARRCRA